MVISADHPLKVHKITDIKKDNKKNVMNLQMHNLNMHSVQKYQINK